MSEKIRGMSESETHEHGDPSGWDSLQSNTSSWSENDWLKSHSAIDRAVRGDQGSWSENEYLASMSGMESEEDFSQRIAKETGTTDPDKQKLVRKLQRNTYSDEILEKSIDSLADEPDTIRSVLEQRLRRTLGDSLGGRTPNADQLRADLKLIGLALKRGIDVGSMRINSEPLLNSNETTRYQPVGKWLDRLANGVSSKQELLISGLDHPDEKVQAVDKITEIRSKLKDPEETPAEKAEREASEAKARAEAEEALNRAREREQRELEIKADVLASLEAQNEKRKQLFEIRALAKEEDDIRNEALAAQKELENYKKSHNFFQKTFGSGKKKIAELAERQAAAKQKADEIAKQKATLIADYEK